MARRGRRGRERGTRKGKRRSGYYPHVEGPRVYKDKPTDRYWKLDLRPFGGKRIVARDPSAPGWPKRGPKTEFEDVAKEWGWAYVRRLQGAKYRNQTGQPEPTPPLAEAKERYIERRRNTVEKNTWQSDRTVLNHMLTHFGQAVEVGNIDSDQLQDFADMLAAKGYMASTIRHYVRTAQTFLDSYGVETGGLELPTTQRTRKGAGPRTFSGAELKRLRKAADKLKMRERFERALCCGPRRQELVAMRWEDFNPRQKTVRISRQANATGSGTRPPKGKAVRTAVVLPEYWEFFDRKGEGFIDEPRPDATRLNEQFRDLLGAAGITDKHIGWHVCRHTYCRIMLEEYAISLNELSVFLGHSKVSTTEAYYRNFSRDAAVRLAQGLIYG